MEEDICPIIDSNINLEDLVSKKTMSDLIQLEKELSSGIKYFDSGMKTMVYENYNKLLQTSEIMEDMRLKLEEIQGTLGLLQGCMNNCLQRSTKLLHEFKPIQMKYIEDTKGKVAFTFIENLYNLPTQLEYYLNNTDLHGFVNLYQSVKHVISNYEHLPCLKPIINLTTKMTSRAKAHLSEKISQEAMVENSNCNEYIKQLIALGESNSNIRALLLQIAKKYCSNITFLHRNDIMKNEYQYGMFPKYLEEFHHFIHSFCDFLQNDDENVSFKESFLSSIFSDFHTVMEVINYAVSNFKLDEHSLNFYIQDILQIHSKLTKLWSKFPKKVEPYRTKFIDNSNCSIMDKLLQHSLSKASDILMQMQNDFLHIIDKIMDDNHNEIMENIKEHKVNSICNILNNIEEIVIQFINLIPWHEDGTCDIFQTLFDHDFFINGVKEYLLCGYFNNLSQCISDLVLKVGNDQPKTRCYFWFHLTFVLSEISDVHFLPLISRFDTITYERFFNMPDGKSDIPRLESVRRALRNASILCSKAFIQKYTEIFFIPIIYEYHNFGEFEQQIDRSKSPSFMKDFYTHMNNFCKFVGYFIKPCAPVNNKASNRIKFSCVGSEVQQTSTMFGAHFLGSTPLDNEPTCSTIPKNCSEMCCTVFKLVLKCLIECVRLEPSTREQVRLLQLELYKVKKALMPFLQNDTKTAHLEMQLSIDLRACSLESVSLYSLEELEHME